MLLEELVARVRMVPVPVVAAEIMVLLIVAAIMVPLPAVAVEVARIGDLSQLYILEMVR